MIDKCSLKFTNFFLHLHSELFYISKIIIAQFYKTTWNDYIDWIHNTACCLNFLIYRKVSIKKGSLIKDPPKVIILNNS